MRVIRTLVSLAFATNICLAAAGGWISPAWRFRTEVTASTASIEGTNVNFPVLVKLTASANLHVFQNALTSGHDIRFTDSDGVTQLPFERVSYDPNAGTAELWVRKPELSDANNTFFLYYGNGDATPGESSALWSEFTAVYHYEDSPGDGKLYESSPAHLVTPVAGSASASWDDSDVLTASKIGRGWIYGPGLTVQSYTIDTNSTSWTVSAWVYMTNDGTDFVMQGPAAFFHLAPSDDSGNEMEYKNDYSNTGSPASISYRPALNTTQGAWHFMAWKMVAATPTLRFFYDGTGYATGGGYPYPANEVIPHEIAATGEPVGIGSTMYPQSTCTDCMQGYVDELRVYPAVLTDDWLKTEYNNQNSPATFLSFGVVEENATCE